MFELLKSATHILGPFFKKLFNKKKCINFWTSNIWSSTTS